MSPMFSLKAKSTLELHRRGKVPGKIWILGRRKAGKPKPLCDVETDGVACQYGNLRRCREKGREESRSCAEFGSAHMIGVCSKVWQAAEEGTFDALRTA